jgi:hypothetical protein
MRMVDFKAIRSTVEVDHSLLRPGRGENFVDSFPPAMAGRGPSSSAATSTI